jgi:hypothetical protein
MRRSCEYCGNVPPNHADSCPFPLTFAGHQEALRFALRDCFEATRIPALLRRVLHVMAYDPMLTSLYLTFGSIFLLAVSLLWAVVTNDPLPFVIGYPIAAVLGLVGIRIGRRAR